MKGKAQLRQSGAWRALHNTSQQTSSYPRAHNSTWAVLLPSDRTVSLCTQLSNTSIRSRECYGTIPLRFQPQLRGEG